MSCVVIRSVFALLGITSAVDLAPRVEIAPDVWMPQLVLNGFPNTSQWIGVGGRGMDTAFSYTEAMQQEVGRAVRDSDVTRSELWVTTKIPCCPKRGGFSMAGGIWPFEPVPGCNVSRDPSADFNLTSHLIGLDYVDLLILHWPCDEFADTLRTWRVMESLVLSGAARAIGISNANSSDLDELYSAAKIKPAVLQVGQAIGSDHNVSLGRDLQTMKRAKELGVTYQAYGALGESHATHPVSCVDIFNDPAVVRIAQRHNRSVAQVAYRWVLEHGLVVVAQSADEGHMRSDLEIFDFQLWREDVEELDAVSCDPSALSETMAASSLI